MAGIVAMMLMWSSAPATALTPVKVLGGPVNQYHPSSNGTYLTWTTVTRDGRQRSVYVKELASGATKKINPVGTNARTSSFVGSSNTVVYTQMSGGNWDIRFYDIDRGMRTRAPGPVNRIATQEWAPMASDTYILFWRQKFSSTGRLVNGWLLLYDRAAETMRTLATGVKYYLPGFAGETYVAWSTCGLQRWFPVCHVFYWSEIGGTVRVAQPEGKNQYAPVIDEANGTMYFVRAASHACGKGVTIRRGALGSDGSAVLASLPAGIDTDYQQSVAPNPASGRLDLYFDRYRCRTNTGDIYALRGVDNA